MEKKPLEMWQIGTIAGIVLLISLPIYLLSSAGEFAFFVFVLAIIFGKVKIEKIKNAKGELK